MATPGMEDSRRLSCQELTNKNGNQQSRKQKRIRPTAFAAFTCWVIPSRCSSSDRFSEKATIEKRDEEPRRAKNEADNLRSKHSFLSALLRLELSDKVPKLGREHNESFCSSCRWLQFICRLAFSETIFGVIFSSSSSLTIIVGLFRHNCTTVSSVVVILWRHMRRPLPSFSFAVDDVFAELTVNMAFWS